MSNDIYISYVATISKASEFLTGVSSFHEIITRAYFYIFHTDYNVKIVQLLFFYGRTKRELKQ